MIEMAALFTFVWICFPGFGTWYHCGMVRMGLACLWFECAGCYLRLLLTRALVRLAVVVDVAACERFLLVLVVFDAAPLLLVGEVCVEGVSVEPDASSSDPLAASSASDEILAFSVAWSHTRLRKLSVGVLPSCC